MGEITEEEEEDGGQEEEEDDREWRRMSRRWIDGPAGDR